VRTVRGGSERLPNVSILGITGATGRANRRAIGQESITDHTCGTLALIRRAAPIKPAARPTGLDVIRGSQKPRRIVGTDLNATTPRIQGICRIPAGVAAIKHDVKAAYSGVTKSRFSNNAKT